MQHDDDEEREGGGSQAPLAAAACLFISLHNQVFRTGPAFHGTSPTDVKLRCQARAASHRNTEKGRERERRRAVADPMDSINRASLFMQNEDGSRSPRCGDPAFYREVMGEQYPTVEVWSCDEE